MEASTGGPEKISKKEILVVMTKGVRVGTLRALLKVEAYQMEWNVFGAVLIIIGQDLVLDTDSTAKVGVITVHCTTLLAIAIREERTTKALLVTKKETEGE